MNEYIIQLWTGCTIPCDNSYNGKKLLIIFRTGTNVRSTFQDKKLLTITQTLQWFEILSGSHFGKGNDCFLFIFSYVLILFYVVSLFSFLCLPKFIIWFSLKTTMQWVHANIIFKLLKFWWTNIETNSRENLFDLCMYATFYSFNVKYYRGYL